MVTTQDQIRQAAERVLQGGAVTLEEACGFIELEGWPEVLELAAQATRIRERFTGNEVDLCALVNAKAGMCPEDCKFCSQSSHWNTGISSYPLMDADQIVERAKAAQRFGAKRFCIVTATRGLADRDLLAGIRDGRAAGTAQGGGDEPLQPQPRNRGGSFPADLLRPHLPGPAQHLEDAASAWDRDLQRR
jgi:hypothetical protein